MRRKMSFVFDINNRLSLLESDENALLDTSDFRGIHENPTQQLIQLMGKSGKRRHSLNTSGDQRLTTTTTDIDDDSGFCGSNLSPNAHKMVRFDEEMLLLKALMKEVNEPVVNTNPLTIKSNAMKVQNNMYSSKSKNGKYELKILSQPEEQHRARYLTEGSRGAIKDRSGLSHPIVKLSGYNKTSLKLECFIGHDKQLGATHLFYQASKITGKNSTRCTTKRVDGTTVIVMDVSPDNDMQVMVDCVGILKERNVDVEQKLMRFKARGVTDNCITIPTKKRSTRCRLVFRTQIPETNEILQVVSNPILCTQPLGTPEICKKSVSQSDAKGGHELFIIGKNFLKDSKVIFKNNEWTKVVEPDKEFLHPTHLICVIPGYNGPQLKTNNSIEVSLSIKSGGKYSEAHKFTFINFERVNTMTLLNGTAQITGPSTPDQLLVSNVEKPIILTMFGSTAVTNSINTQMVTQSSLPLGLTSFQSNPLNGLDSETLCYTSDNSRADTVLSIINEDSQMTSNIMNTTSLESPNESQMNQILSPKLFSFEKTIEESHKNTSNDTNGNQKVFKTETMDTSEMIETSVTLPEQVSQYLPLNSFNTITSPLIVNNSSQLTDVSIIPAMTSMSCGTISSILEPIPSTPMTTILMSTISSEPNLSLTTSLASNEPKVNITESMAMKSITAQNPVMTSTASTTPLTQATNISALSEMTDAELLCFINPATFDQI